MDPNSQRMMMGAASGAAAIEFVASAQAQNGGTNTVVINKPTGVQQGDLLIAFCAAGNDRSWTGDTGWTEIVDQGVKPALRVAYLVAGASEPASYTFTINSNSNGSGVIAAFRYAAYDTIGSVATNNISGVQTASAITLSSANSAILAFFAAESSSRTWSNPTSGLVSTATDSDGTGPSFALYRELNLSSGSTGTRSATCSSSAGAYACILVGIKPA